MQGHLELIPHRVGTDLIQQRVADGYINATAICKAAGKSWSAYVERNDTAQFLEALVTESGLNRFVLVQSNAGTSADERGVWVHPQVAIHLAQWLSPKFSVMVTKWVYDWMSGKHAPRPAQMPYHLRRYVSNYQNVPTGHFSVLTELTLLLIAPMEAMGYSLPERMLPDISQGRMFCKWLREVRNIDTDTLPTYQHRFEDGRVVSAKAYPEELLNDFRKHFREEWLPNQAIKYFTGKDNTALQYLPKLLPAVRTAPAQLNGTLKSLPKPSAPRQV